MRIYIKILSITILLVLFLMSNAYAQETLPALPSLCYGQLTINDEPAPIGTVVFAKVNGVLKDKLVTTEKGWYGGPGIKSKLAVVGDNLEGKQVVFYATGKFDGENFSEEKAGVVNYWGSGEVKEINLSIAIDKEIQPPPTGGGGGGGVPPTKPEPPSSVEPKINDLIADIKVDLKSSQSSDVRISQEIINNMVEKKKSLVIENNSISLIVPPEFISTEQLKDQNEKSIEFTIEEVSEEMQSEIILNAEVGNSTGLYNIGGKIFHLQALMRNVDNSVEDMTSFNKPIKIEINLSDAELNEEDYSNLTGVRYEKTAEGEIVPVKLGGTYNPKTKKFTFYTSSFSYYGVLKATDLKQLHLTINSREVKINNKLQLIDVPPMIVNNRTMVPLRLVAEGLGAEVKWISEAKTVMITKGSTEITMVVDKPNPGYDAPPVLMDSRVLVPIRYISQSLGASVTWYATSKEIHIVQ